MARHRRHLLVILGLVLSATLHVNHARARDAWNPKAAAAYLDGRAKWWLDWPSAARGQATACISCHTTFPIVLARPALGKQLGETEASGLEKRLIVNLTKRVDNWDKIVAENTADKDPFRPFYGGTRKLSALGTESVLNALVLVNHDKRWAKAALSESTKKALANLWGQQQKDGAWLWLDFGLRPWETDAPYFGASLAALAVGLAGKDYQGQEDVQPKLAALKKYLTSQYANQRLHHRMVALWASSKLPGILAEQDRKNLIDEILNAREPDGGWSSPTLGKFMAKKGAWTSQGVTREGAVSDGYATGLAVLTLKSAGLTANDANVKKGVAWLIAQQKDGTWPAIYLNKNRDPETDVGKFMRDAATAFAVLALVD